MTSNTGAQNRVALQSCITAAVANGWNVRICPSGLSLATGGASPNGIATAATIAAGGSIDLVYDAANLIWRPTR